MARRQRNTVAPRTLLAVGTAGAELDELAADLRERGDLLLMHCPQPSALPNALDRGPVAMLILCTGLSPSDAATALRVVEAARPGIPILVVRGRDGAVDPRWSAPGVAVIREPLLPHALSRSVDVVLGLTGGERR